MPAPAVKARLASTACSSSTGAVTAATAPRLVTAVPASGTPTVRTAPAVHRQNHRTAARPTSLKTAPTHTSARRPVYQVNTRIPRSCTANSKPSMRGAIVGLREMTMSTSACRLWVHSTRSCLVITGKRKIRATTAMTSLPVMASLTKPSTLRRSTMALPVICLASYSRARSRHTRRSMPAVTSRPVRASWPRSRRREMVGMTTMVCPSPAMWMVPRTRTRESSSAATTYGQFLAKCSTIARAAILIMTV